MLYLDKSRKVSAKSRAPVGARQALRVSRLSPCVSRRRDTHPRGAGAWRSWIPEESSRARRQGGPPDSRGRSRGIAPPSRGQPPFNPDNSRVWRSRKARRIASNRERLSAGPISGRPLLNLRKCQVLCRTKAPGTFKMVRNRYRRLAAYAARPKPMRRTAARNSRGGLTRANRTWSWPKLGVR